MGGVPVIPADKPHLFRRPPTERERKLATILIAASEALRPVLSERVRGVVGTSEYPCPGNIGCNEPDAWAGKRCERHRHYHCHTNHADARFGIVVRVG